MLLHKKKKRSSCSLHHVNHLNRDNDDHLYCFNCSPNQRLTDIPVKICRKECSSSNIFHFCLPSSDHFLWTLVKSLSSFSSTLFSFSFFSITWILFLVLCTLFFQTSSALPSSSSLSSSSFPICRQDRSLCSSKEESEFYELGGQQLNSLLGEPMRKVANEFDDFHRKFNDEVTNLLENSKYGFHSMFTRTYGQLYHKHSSLFTHLFEVLRSYYDTNSVNLETEFGLFFTNLYQKIFQELNFQYSFTDEYMKCPQTYMHLLNPFGDVPKKLIIEFQRSFTAAKVFSQSIKSASDLIKSVKEQPVTPNCQKYFIQMNYCQRCENSSNRIPCYGYCSSVISLCTSSNRHLNKDWNSQLDKLLAIMNRLENSFSIEAAVGPLDIKISEAIMNFQENGVNITKKIWQYCGKPKVGKRRAINRESYDSPSPSSGNFGYSGSDGSPLGHMLNEFKKNLKKFKDLWIKLPETICNSSLSTSTINHDKINNPTESCWNQSDATQQQQLTDRGEPVIEKIEFIKSQRMLMRTVNQKLDAAYKGSEIQEDDETNGGSGSGSGDGDYEDYKDYDEDDENPDDLINKPSTSSPQSSSSSSSSSNVDLSSSGSTTVKIDDLLTKSNSTIKFGEKIDSNESNKINSTATIINNQQSPSQSSNNQLKDSSSLAQQSRGFIFILIILSIFSAQSL
ncbi:glypican-6-like [Panonychus citri]|uniref:glypican-6-like n=1 Tax=Panonychus citri TaxID=50023 RepID=UPI002307D243|nr:glypican-6-like [Panonychus citri]